LVARDGIRCTARLNFNAKTGDRRSPLRGSRNFKTAHASLQYVLASVGATFGRPRWHSLHHKAKFQRKNGRPQVAPTQALHTFTPPATKPPRENAAAFLICYQYLLDNRFFL
jgi:hypothetical protein